jgi:lauroyl/myristoyl acyltransferase
MGDGVGLGELGEWGVSGRGVVSGRLADLACAAGWGLIKVLPASVSWALFRAGADRAARRQGPGAQRLRGNLRRVVGAEVTEEEMDRLLREALRSYARYWLDVFRLPVLSKEQVLRDFRFKRGHLLGEALASGRGAVVALPHAGNWDFAGAWACAQGWPITTVAERLKPETLYQRFVAFRASLGMEIIPVRGGERPPMDILVERLAEPRLVPLLADRDLSARGVEVEFFGGRTRMPAGPALLAIRTGVPLFTASLWYSADGHPRGRLDGPLPIPPPESGSIDERVRTLTQAIADHLAQGITEHPTDWHMLQRLWLDDPSRPMTEQRA